MLDTTDDGDTQNPRNTIRHKHSKEIQCLGIFYKTIFFVYWSASSVGTQWGFSTGNRNRNSKASVHDIRVECRVIKYNMCLIDFNTWTND